MFLRFVLLRAFVCRFFRLSTTIRSGVRQGGAESAPPAGRVRPNTPAGRGLSERAFKKLSNAPFHGAVPLVPKKRRFVVKCKKMICDYLWWPDPWPDLKNDWMPLHSPEAELAGVLKPPRSGAFSAEHGPGAGYLVGPFCPPSLLKRSYAYGFRRCAVIKLPYAS